MRIAHWSDMEKLGNISMANFSANQTLMKATSFEKKGKAGQARDLYLRVLESFPGNTRAAVGLTRTHEVLVSKHLETLWLLLEDGQAKVVLNKAQILVKKFTHAFSLWNLFKYSLILVIIFILGLNLYTFLNYKNDALTYFFGVIFN